MLLLGRLDTNSLEELKEYVKKAVKNPNVRREQLKAIDRVIGILQSSGGEPGRLFVPLDGTSAGSCVARTTISGKFSG